MSKLSTINRAARLVDYDGTRRVSDAVSDLVAAVSAWTLLPPTGVAVGSYRRYADGAPVVEPNWTTAVYPCSDYAVFRVSATISGSPTALVVWYDANGLFHSADFRGVNNSPVFYRDFPIRAPLGARSFAVSALNANGGAITVEAGTLNRQLGALAAASSADVAKLRTFNSQVLNWQDGKFMNRTNGLIADSAGFKTAVVACKGGERGRFTATISGAADVVAVVVFLNGLGNAIGSIYPATGTSQVDVHTDIEFDVPDDARAIGFNIFKRQGLGLCRLQFKTVETDAIRADRQRLNALESGAAIRTRDAVAASTWYTLAVGAAKVGYYYAWNTGAETNVGGVNFRTFPAIPVLEGETLRLSGTISGTVTALVVFVNGAGEHVGYGLQGVANDVVYVDQPVIVPAGASQALITAKSAVTVRRFGIDPALAGLPARMAAAEVGVTAINNLAQWYVPAGYAVVAGSYYNKFTGATADLAQWHRLPPIPVTPGKAIRVTATVSGAATALVVWLDANQAWVGKVLDGIDNSPVEYVDQEVIPPANAAFALVCSYFPTSSKEPRVKVYGVDPNLAGRITAAEAGITANSQAIALLQAGGGGRWTGRKILWMGTSIPQGNTSLVTIGGVTYQNNYPKMIGSMLGANVVNVALGSSIIRAGILANVAAGDPLGWTGMRFDNLWRALSQTLAHKDELITNWESKWRALLTGDRPDVLDATMQANIRGASFENRLLPNLDADLFVFDHGHNDAAVAPGEYAGNELVAQFNANPASRDRTTFHGAINAMIDLILAANPKARICFSGHYEDARKAQIVQAQALVADFWGFPIMKLWERTGWSQQVITGTGPSAGKTMTQVWLPDDLHPSSDATGDATYLLATILATEISRVR